MSDLLSIRFGVPQGSVLGTLLLQCYLTYMTLPLNNIHLYTDELNFEIFGTYSIDQIKILTNIGVLIFFFQFP